MSERKVAVAYVTKYAETRGILLLKDVEISENGYCYCGFVSAGPKEWTEDRAVAEARYRAALLRARNLAEEKMKRIQAALDGPPKYEEKS